MDLPVNSIAGRPGSGSILLTTPAGAGELGNSVLSFNPSTAKVDWSTWVGSEPTALTVAPDGALAYAKLQGEHRIGQVNLRSGERDTVFAADPSGRSIQYDFYDMAALAGGGIAVSYYGGAIAAFDNGIPRPLVDWNTQGAFAFLAGTLKLGASQDGTKIYGFETTWSFAGTKRSAVSAQGIQWLSSSDGFYLGDNYVAGGGLIYTSRGTAIDPERWRLAGIFALRTTFGDQFAVAPDVAGRRIFFANAGQIQMFDASTYALMGSMTIPPPYTGGPLKLVRFGDDGLAFNTEGHVYFVSISAIPLLASPVSSPQPAVPATAGVTVVDVQSQDLAYDASRNLIYAATPTARQRAEIRFWQSIPLAARSRRTWRPARTPGTLPSQTDRAGYHTRRAR